VSNTRKLRTAPGLRGDYSGTCIVCLTPTDTGLGFRGEAEFVIAGLRVLGVPEDEEYTTFRAGWADAGHDLEDGEVPDGIIEVPVRVCTRCVSRCPAKFPAPALAMAGATLPTVTQHGAVA
jgi:hypothetical protein